jgi:hypothetical protein
MMPVRLRCPISGGVHEAETDAPVVVFVGHAFLLGSVGLDVDDVADAVVDEVRRQFHGAML